MQTQVRSKIETHFKPKNEFYQLFLKLKIPICNLSTHLKVKNVLIKNLIINFFQPFYERSFFIN